MGAGDRSLRSWWPKNKEIDSASEDTECTNVEWKESVISYEGLWQKLELWEKKIWKAKTKEDLADLVSTVTEDFLKSQKGPNWKEFWLSRNQKDQGQGERWVDLAVGVRE